MQRNTEKYREMQRDAGKYIEKCREMQINAKECRKMHLVNVICAKALPGSVLYFEDSIKMKSESEIYILGRIAPNLNNLKKWVAAGSKLDKKNTRVPVRLSLVAFQLWGVLEQLAPEIFLNNFFKTGDLSMVQLTQKIQKISKM